ncbi:tuberin-like [Amphibalanus amphitrite]|uniref:tuberin-like n=1 Tax=Amphibalanus amphitrite TaxID=1232801 RepID=UPI001C8FEC24|nr:tuberin-like [Amphibalanus amphitrite]
MSKEKDKHFQDKLKKFFKHNRDGSNYSQYLSQPFEYTADLQQSLRSHSQPGTRVRALQDLVERVRRQRLDDLQLVSLVADVADLLEPTAARDTRQAVLAALTALVAGQLEHMTAAKEELLGLVDRHNVAEDLLPRVRLLSALTENGRNLTYIEEEMPSLLVRLLPEALLQPVAGGGQRELLTLLQNTVKFNAAYVEPEHVRRCVELVYERAAAEPGGLDTASCLSLLDVILCYRDLPRGALVRLSALLARLVCRPEHAKHAWRIMRNLLGTSMGPVTLQVLTDIIMNRSNANDAPLLKGCVFFGATALWGGEERVASLLHRPGALLPALAAALDSPQPAVWHEVALELRRLVSGPQAGELLPHAWDALLDLVDRLYGEAVSGRPPLAQAAQQVRAHLAALLAAIEQLVAAGRFSGDDARLAQTLELCAADRPEANVVATVRDTADRLLTYRYTWLPELRQLVARYFERERRTAVRLAVCEVLQRVWDGFRSLEAGPLLETVLLPAAAGLPAEPDPLVRARLVSLLVRVAGTCRSPHCLEVMTVLEKVLNAPLEAGRPPAAGEVAALVAAAEGFCELLSIHLDSLPSALAVKAYRAMVDHLGRHYTTPEVLLAAPEVREPLLLTLLSLRVGCREQIGLPDPATGVVRFSPHLLAEQRNADAPAGGPAPAAVDGAPHKLGPSETRVSLAGVCLTVISALRHERDFALLSELLRRVPRLLENKALVVSEHSADVDYFAQAMCQLTADITPALCSRLVNVPADVKTSDLQSLVYPILVSLTSYHGHMSMPMHRRLIGSLESGLRSRCAPQCMTALTVCALGMREAMAKVIHDVLFGMSKLSATVAMGNSVLEFISTLIRIPKVYSCFNEEKYMSIFAIVLPYTNPAKFNHYIVSLAHHVIAMWFLKCRVKYRRGVVKYIIKGLKTNFSSIQELLRQQQASKQAADNEDSSNRRRSSSLSDRASQARGRETRTFPLSRRAQETPPDPGGRRGSLAVGGGPPPPPPPPPIPVTEELIKFHRELTETCVDLMSRYTGANFAVLPERTAVMELLLAGGLSNTWVIGNRLVTITVGGCGGTVFRRALCERCYNLCCAGLTDDTPTSPPPELDTPQPPPPPPAPSAPLEVRRRHISTPVGRGAPVAESPPLRDDSQLKVRAAAAAAAAAAGDQPNSPGTGAGPGGGRLCSCWCQGWAEVLVRRPSGNMAWMTRLENRQLVDSDELPLPDLLSLIAPGTADQTMEKLLKQTESPAESATSPPASAPVSPPAPPEISIIQEDGDGAGEAPDEGGGPRRLLPLSRTRSGETRRHSLFKSVSGSQMPPQSSPRLGRDRSHTISVMSPTRRAPPSDGLGEDGRLGLLPEQVLLQLFHSPELDAREPYPEPAPANCDVLLLENGPETERTLAVFDRITPMETHKIGVLYVGAGQAGDEPAILRNQCGSTRYNQFLKGLGHLVELTEAHPKKTFLAGLDRSEKRSDGRFAIMWEDDLMQVLFHVATMMPTVDERCNNKKMHIGNDFVLIVYNESGQPFNITSIRAQFCYAGVVVEPLDHGTNRIVVNTKGKLQELFGHTEVTLVSDQNVAAMARQLALHANLASLIQQRGVAGPDPYASNWLERLRHIKRVRRRVADARQRRLQERRKAGEDMAPHSVDFTQLLE